MSIFGGKGSIAGVVLAVLAFAGLQNALLLTNFNQEAAGIVTGALLLLSVFGRNAAALLRPVPEVATRAPWPRIRPAGRRRTADPSDGEYSAVTRRLTPAVTGSGVAPHTQVSLIDRIERIQI